MDEDPNQLIEAPEDDDINDLNDETFGDFVENFNGDWETHHDHLAYVGYDVGYPDDDLDELELQESDLEHTLSQLVVDDDDEDEDDDAQRHTHSVPIKKKAINLDELFGPQSPPRLFDSDDLVVGHPSIWGSPARESQLQGSSNELQGLLKTLLQKSSANSHGQLNKSAAIPGGAKTLEEIEQELLRSSAESAVTSRPNGESVPMLTVDQLERKLRGQSDNDVQPASLPPTTQPSTTLSAVLTGGSVPVTRIPGLLPIVPGSIPRMPLPTVGTAAGVHKPHLAADSRHLPAAGPATQPPWTQVPPHLLNSANRMNINREHAARVPLPPARGYPGPGGMPFNSAALNYPPRMLRHPSDGVPYGQHRHVMPTNTDQAQLMNMLRSRRPTVPGMFPGMHRPPFSLQQQLYHQQMMQRQQRFPPSPFAGDPVRAASMHPPLPLLQHTDAQGGIASREPRTQQPNADEYAGLMTQREKDWVVKIQLLQLHTDNPYVDDYYYTCWSVKKMLKERQSREGLQPHSKDSEPALVLPQLAKLETKAYSPTQFEGALGRLTASSIHNPRQIINVHIAPGSESEDTRGVVEVKRFKEFLLHIEKGYDSLLNINDVEKKALAQPPENRQVLYDERTQLISRLFQHLAAGHAASDAGTETSSDVDGLAQVISIRKGLLLVIRLMPLLNQNDTDVVTCLLLQRFAAKKEWSSEILPRVYSATERVIQSADLQHLVQFSNAVCCDESTSSTAVLTDKNRVNCLVSVLQNKYGVSVLMSLLNRAEHVFSSESILDLDTEHQTHWRQFVENVASAIELLNTETFGELLGQYPLVSGHFRRILDKRSQLLVEDKLETLLSCVTRVSTTVT